MRTFASMGDVLVEFLQILIGGITTLARGVAEGIVTMAKLLFLDISVTEGVETINGLSVFGGIVGIFAGIGIAVGITSMVYRWVTSLGN